MSGAASPYAITARPMRRNSGASAVYGSPLCLPPSSRTVGRVMPRMRDERRCHVRRLGIVDPRDAVDAPPPSRCDARARGMPRSRVARCAASACGVAVLPVGQHDGQRRRQRVRDVVVAEQRQLVALHQRMAEHDQRRRVAVVGTRRVRLRPRTGSGRPATCSRHAPARSASSALVTQLDAGLGVPEEQRLVGVVLVDARRTGRDGSPRGSSARRRVGSMLGVSCSWNDDISSATHAGGVVESASSESGVPMFPAVDARRPSAVSRWPMSAVVVVLPFVPVIAMYASRGQEPQPDLDLAHDVARPPRARRRTAARPAERRDSRRRATRARCARGRGGRRRRDSLVAQRARRSRRPPATPTTSDA